MSAKKKKVSKKPVKKTPAKKGGAAKKSTGSSLRTSSPKDSKGKPGKSARKKPSSGSQKTPTEGNVPSSPSSTPATAVTTSKRQKRLPEGVDFSTLTPAKNVGISRIDQATKANHGWYVRMGPPEARITRFFGDKKFGSRNKAFVAAKAFRDEQFTSLPDWYKLRASKGTKKQAA